MKKQILNIGTALSRAEQKEVMGSSNLPINVIGDLACPFALGCPCNQNGTDCGGSEHCLHSHNAPDGYYGFCAA